MNKTKFKNLVLSIGLIYSPTIPLPHLHADPDQISVSGLSSGAMMAEQILVANSDRIIGAGIIAGGTYGCAQGLVDLAINQCSKTPESISIDSLATKTIDLANQRQISPLENLKNRKLFIFNGKNDRILSQAAGQKLLEWSKKFINEENIVSEFSIPAGHGFPTTNWGSECFVEKSPWINNCGYDTTKNIFQHIYQRPLIPGIAVDENLIHFDQIPFLNFRATMALDGYVYVPTDCKLKNSRCAIHVALHGCSQTTDFVQEAFIKNAGYNSWAESNKIIVLYPMVAPSFYNPKICWDWWGYTGGNYLTRTAPQIQTIMKMIDHLVQK